MRFRTFPLFYSAILVWLTNGHPLQYIKTALSAQRDLLGILGGADGNPGSTSTLASSLALTTPHEASSLSAGPTSTGATSAAVATIAVSGSKPSSPSSLTRMASSSTTAPYPDPATVTYSSVSFQIGYVADAPTTPPGELTEWKVIGIAVTTITFIGTVILSVVFFDSWWGFVCAVVCGKRSRKQKWQGEETLVPDWEKRSWEFRLANEGGHRYPTMASLESIVKEKEKVQKVGRKRELDIKSPEMAFGRL